MADDQPLAQPQQPSQQPRRMPSIGEGIRTGVGILSAFKEAIEETIQEAMKSGDATRPEGAAGATGSAGPEGARAQQDSTATARSLVDTAFARAQETVGDLRERLDLVPRKEFEALQTVVNDLRHRLATLEARQAAAGEPGIRPEGGYSGEAVHPSDGTASEPVF